MIDLTRFGLSRNPFDIAADPSITADRQTELEAIQRSLRSAFDAPSTRLVVMLGDYGVGKTHMLQYLYSQLALSPASSTGVLAMIVSGLRSPDILYERPLAIMETEPRSSKFGLSLVSRILTTLGPDKYSEVLHRVDKRHFSGRFGNLFSALRDGSSLALEYLDGAGLNPNELKQLGLRSKLSDSPTGLALYFDWLKYVALAGYHTFLVLVDEFEYIALQGESKVSQILNTFRDMMDRGTVTISAPPTRSAKSVFVLAVSPGGWNRLKELETASVRRTGGGGIAPFMERISPRDIINLSPFTIADTRELVQLRLAAARLGKPRTDIAPFTKDAISYIHEAASRKPRNVIQYCGIILEDAVEEGLTEIGLDHTKRLLARYGIQVPTQESLG